MPSFQLTVAMSYAVSALLSAVGENRLMPNPDFECIVINGKTGYVRNNKSWILARILRDYEYWRDTGIDTTMASELARLEKEEKEKAKGEYREAKAVRLGLCVSVYRAVEISGIPKPDPLYWTGYGVVLVQLAISIIPWAIYADRQWLTFMVTAVGTVLAFLSAALPQWKEEKFKVRTQDPGKVVILTQGNGAQHAIAIACDAINGLDLEALASPYRDLKSQTFTRLCSCLLAIAWLCLLICVTGYSGSTWFLLANGLLGIFHNIIVAGCPRNPSAYGMNLVYEKTFTARKVMAVLADLEDYKPRLGASLVPTFFPGELLNREVKFWEYAERRAKAFEGDAKTAKKAKTIPLPWKMPPLEGDQEAKDIPLTLVYGTRVPNAVTSV
ncbi:hypothetical protein KCU77_g1817, partial [Aureobasidium melanogenum]